MIYYPYKILHSGILTECWEPGPFIYNEKTDLFHRLDCPDVNARNSRESVFLKSIRHLRDTAAKPCPKCGPKTKDAYRQCLICGTFLPTDRGMRPLTCQCGELEVDFSPPGLVRIISKSNLMLSRHIGTVSSRRRHIPKIAF